MELKFVVSVVLYYVYVYLKTREKKEKTIKQVFLSFDLFLFLIPLLVFIEDDLTKMALFLFFFMALALVVVYKKENLKEIMKKKNQILILLPFFIPTIVYLFFFFLFLLVLVYCILGSMLYLYDFLYFLINKWKRKREHDIIKKK